MPLFSIQTKTFIQNFASGFHSFNIQQTFTEFLYSLFLKLPFMKCQQAYHLEAS